MATDIESPSDWARRVCRSLPPCDLNSIMARNAIVEAVTARDAAIRAEALREGNEALDAHVVNMHELNAVQHRVIVCALAGDMAPARRYAELERKLADEAPRG